MNLFAKHAEGKDRALLNHPWATILRDGMARSAPQLLTELKADDALDDYVISKLSGVLEMVDLLISQGTPREMAEELGRQDLIPSD